MKSLSLTFATQMLFRRSESEIFDTFKNNILLRIFFSPGATTPIGDCILQPSNGL